MEIERKFKVKTLPVNLEQYPFHLIEQAYLNTDPVVRIRKEDERYYLTYKGKGLLAREEYNLPLNEESYLHLREKADGNVISKKRYLIPIENPTFLSNNQSMVDSVSLTIELDILMLRSRILSLRKWNSRTKKPLMPFSPWTGSRTTLRMIRPIIILI